MNEAYSTKFKQLLAMKNNVGMELGVSKWYEVTQDAVDSFARLTEDHQWIHTNPEKAAHSSPYGATVAHGFYILAMTTKFTREAFQIEDRDVGINYGLDKVRFPNAVRVGSLIRGRVSLQGYDEIENGARFKVKVLIEIKEQDKPACVAEFLIQMYVDPDKSS